MGRMAWFKPGRLGGVQGGAATAIYTAGQFASADFDVVAGQDEVFNAAMAEHGFVREDRVGHLLFGFYHSEHPGYGFQQVSGALFEGRADRGRLVRLAASAAGEIALPAIEDMIADRLAQHAAMEGKGSDDSRLVQARVLFSLARTIDRDYLLRRIMDEGGDPAVLDLGS